MLLTSERKSPTEVRRISKWPQEQGLSIYSSHYYVLTGALRIRLFKIRLNSPNSDLLCTQVMQLYDGLSINKMKHLSVKVKELTPSVKLVKLEPNLPPAGNIWNKFTSLFTRANPETAKGFQVKMVDMGGHTATPLKAFHSVHFSKLS